MKPTIEIAGRRIGGDAPCFVVAEAGSNHNGSLETALRLVEVAARSGASAVKFQTFRARELYPTNAGVSDYLGDATPIFDLMRAMEMPDEWLPALRARSMALGLAFISSPFHEAAIDLLAPHVDAFKIASYELTHAPLLRAVARHGKPVILSTGASTIDEVAEAVSVLGEAGCRELVLLQCTASYPAPPEAVNARALQTLARRFAVPTGLSDHSRDPVVAPLVAVALGAAVIEKHFTLGNDLPGPDHAFALTPNELTKMVARIRAAELVMGGGEKVVHGVENELRHFARRSLFTTRPIAAGERFSPDNVAILRHGRNRAGLPPSARDRVLASSAAQHLEGEVALQPEHLEATSRARGEVSLRPVVLEDARRVFEWVNDPVTRAASFSTDPIAWETHEDFFKDAIGRTDRHLLIALEDGRPAGVLRLEGPDGDQVEVGIHVAPEARGRGLARRILAAGETEALRLGATRILARIKPGNAASVRTFEGAGYVSEGTAEVSGLPALRYVLMLSRGR